MISFLIQPLAKLMYNSRRVQRRKDSAEGVLVLLWCFQFVYELLLNFSFVE